MRWSEQQLADYRARHGTCPDGAPSLADPPFACPPDEVQPVTFTLAGDPQGKGRARAARVGAFVRMYTPAKTRSYEGMIRTAAMDAMGFRPPIDVPVELTLRAVFAVPASWSKKKRAAAILGGIKPAKKPDLDNIAKAWSDAMNGVVYRDDAQIVRVALDKRFGLSPMVLVTVRAA